MQRFSLLEYCRNNVCSNVPRRNLGDSCDVDNDCTGYDEGIAFYCGTDGKCGGTGAACQANDRTAEGESGYCVSGMFSVPGLVSRSLARSLFSCDIEYCSAGFCSSGLDASPTPNAKRQLVQPGQVRQQLCAAGMVACPVQPKGYEVSSCFRPCEAIRPVLTWFLSRCINTWADLESCGGCPGSLKEDGTPLGVDCTALPNVDIVSCLEGSCAIGKPLNQDQGKLMTDVAFGTCASSCFSESCVEGYVYTAANATCVAV
jgi:hypothetical protein